MRRSIRTILIIWLVWGVVMVAYQAYILKRVTLKRPDYAVSWTAHETTRGSQKDKPYLLEKFLNDHVSWDSEYYLSIAIAGYDDPEMRAIPPDFSWDDYREALLKDEPEWISMNYAFFPFYPLMIRLLMQPLKLLGMTPIATATLAGVLVSMLGALGAMIALWDMARDALGEEGGVRAAFYLLIWPAGMFLAQVYTEGLFLGLSFGALALARRQRWIWAGLLAAFATWTRAAGGLLLLPLVWYWWRAGEAKRLVKSFDWRTLAGGLFILAPIAAYLVWAATLGPNFHLVEDNFFGRGLLLFRQSAIAWGAAWLWMHGSKAAGQAYYMVEFAAIVFGLFVSVWMWRFDRALAVYSLLTIIFALTSGAAQGMHRYVMAAPALFLVPASWGRSEAFDRSWTLANVLLMGVFAMTFSFDFWAG